MLRKSMTPVRRTAATRTTQKQSVNLATDFPEE
jgi:hypothetical protein